MDRNKDTRCIAVYITIQVFHIAIRFLAYRCTPTIQRVGQKIAQGTYLDFENRSLGIQESCCQLQAKVCAQSIE